ncbi:hypothetical protein SAMN05443634_11074 [Chishuiella changwenlii]|uniref:DUF2071 domain-containing protein n=1 Tax=Chishuiella changwenlii TaxID=1434701 RepID=A0A1M7B7M1_9FLAO|nr:DUF2071 domain-containing protein [Chishuiella changwenlii]GGE96065.1 hypothetical protein GCM10010984_11980 [Chishuiella changwenlii]SHL50980.1 hypothetical protein SAMN05443634_11074 [Chishuiella changwenlii]
MEYSISQILEQKEHRSWSYPSKKWSYYQEWNNALFFHYEVDKNILQDLVPDNLEIDLINGKAWVSVVAFAMERIRPRFLPSVSSISNFGEINVRTYVTKDNKPGVYFLSIEAEKLMSAILAKSLSGLPYEKSTIKRTKNSYQAQHSLKGFSLGVDYYIGMEIKHKNELDLFLTERYCLYLNKGKDLFRYEIQHLPWNLNQLELDYLQLDYKLGNLILDSNPNFIHYSTGVQVVAWEKEKL